MPIPDLIYNLLQQLYFIREIINNEWKASPVPAYDPAPPTGLACKNTWTLCSLLYENLAIILLWKSTFPFL